MKITFLGTGTSQGIPVIGCIHEVCLSNNEKDKRLRSSALIEWDDFTYVIDCGPDFREQMLKSKVARIDGIIFTHDHADHTAGLDDIRPFSHQTGSVSIYAMDRVMKNLRTRFYYIFKREDRYPGAPKVEENIISKSNFKLKNLKIIPIEIVHGRLDIFGFRFDKLAYITDASFILDKEKDKLFDLDVLVLNALRIDKHPTHFNLEEALELIEELKPKKAYLTHISHKLGLHDKVSKLLPANVFLAFDGLTVEI